MPPAFNITVENFRRCF